MSHQEKGTLAARFVLALVLLAGTFFGARFVDQASAAPEDVTRASLSVNEARSNGPSDWATLSADGRVIAPYSDASNLVVADGLGGEAVYPSTSSGGQYVSFTSFANNPATNDTNAAADNFVYEQDISVVPSPTPGGTFPLSTECTNPLTCNPVAAIPASWRCNSPDCSGPDWPGAVISWPSWSAYQNNARTGNNARIVFSMHGGEPLYPYMGSWADGCQVTVVSGHVLIIEWQRGTDVWRATSLTAGQSHTIDLISPEDNAMIESPDGFIDFKVSLANCTPQNIYATATPSPTFTPTATSTATFTPSPTFTPSSTPTQTPTATPVPSSNPLYISLFDNQTVGGVASADEDILRFNGSTWSLFFDGSDVGLAGTDLVAFEIIDSDSILMAFNTAVTVGGISVTPQDIVRFNATSLGMTTAGTFKMHFDGSDVELTTPDESIDAIARLPDRRLLISTNGNPTVNGIPRADEDVLIFTPTSLGSVTAGTWKMYFDGSDVGLADVSGEDVDALDVTPNGSIYLSIAGKLSVNGLTGVDEDVFICVPISTGSNTACNYSPALYFDGSTWGLADNDVDAFHYPEP